MAKKTYTIRQSRSSRFSDTVRTHDYTGTIEELTEMFSYTLLKGASWQNERGNKKINQHPKTIQSLLTNLENAENNAARDGYSGVYYDLLATA